MKKMLVAAALALAVTVACQQKASAWADFKFSAGVNISWTTGGNCLFGGLFKGADIPPWYNAGCGYGFGGFPYGYQAPSSFYYGYNGGYADPSWQAPAPAAAAAAPAANTAGVAPQSYPAYYYNSGYQPVGYYYYPGYYPQVPSYWYGGR